MNQFQFFTVFRTGAVKRFHTYPIIGEQTIASHSWGVAMILYKICDKPPRPELIFAALTHDCPEGYTGDVPFGIKKENDEVKLALETAEADWIDSVNLSVSLTADEMKLIKIADCLDGMNFCYEQLKLGNRGILRCFWAWDKHLATLGPLPQPARMIHKTLVECVEEFNTMDTP